jgi:hypothetical protein
MRNKRYFRENVIRPTITVEPRHDLLEDEGIILKPKPNFKIDFSIYKESIDIDKAVWRYFFMDSEEGDVNNIYDEMYEFIRVTDSENMGNLFDNNDDLYQSDVEDLSLIYEITSKEDPNWNQLFTITERIKGKQYDVSEVKEVLFDFYKGSTANLERYLEDMGIYTLETSYGFLLFDIN